MAGYDYRISRTSKVKEARARIVKALDETGRRVFSTQDLVKLFQANRENWWVLATASALTRIDPVVLG